MSIADVLHGKGHEIVNIRASETVERAVRLLAERQIGALVVEDDWMHLAGIFSERDFLNAVARMGKDVLGLPVSKLMRTPVLTCTPTDRVETVMATMTMAKVRHLPVMEAGHLVGIVSIGDLVKHRLDEKALEASVLLDIARRHG